MGRHSQPDDAAQAAPRNRWFARTPTDTSAADAGDRQPEAGTAPHERDATQVIPRITEGAWPSYPPAPATEADRTSVFARTSSVEPTAVRSAGAAVVPQQRLADGLDNSAAEPDSVTEPSGTAAASTPGHRNRRLVWVGLLVFWLISLGAGLVGLIALGARASCTGNDSSLDCGNTGSAIAVVLTLAVILLVGALTVRALDQRDRVRLWGRDLALGVVVMALLAFAAWRLILSIRGGS